MEILDLLGNWPTIVLVAVTMVYVVLIYESILQSSRDRELDFKRRQLDWITNWAQMGVSMLTRGGHHRDLILRLITIHSERKGIMTSCRVFRQDFINAVFKAVQKLEQLCDVKVDDLPPEPKLSIKLETDRTEALVSFAELLESANSLKVELHL